MPSSLANIIYNSAFIISATNLAINVLPTLKGLLKRIIIPFPLLIIKLLKVEDSFI
jgi:hypothetical protein